MLVLSRKRGESLIFIHPSGDIIEVCVKSVINGRVQLGTQAPREIRVHRKEVWEQIKKKEEPG